MKKVLFFMMLLATVTARAQGEMKNGIYETKTVREIENLTSEQLYVRTLEVLSDWAGSQNKSKANIDVQDKDGGIVVYKGSYYLGYRKQNLLYGWDTFADFTLKARSKDGKIQVSASVPSMTFKWDATAESFTEPLSSFYPDYAYKGKVLLKKPSTEFAPQIPTVFDTIVNQISDNIIQREDDDF